MATEAAHGNEVMDVIADIQAAMLGSFVIMANEQSRSHALAIITIFIDFMQMLGFIFHHHVWLSWYRPTISWFMDVLDVFRIGGWLMQRVNVLFLFLIAIVLVLILLINVLYVGWAHLKQDYRHMWALKLLQKISSIFTGVLLIPILAILFAVITCSNPQDDEDFANDELCWSSYHAPLAFFATFITIAYVGFSLLVAASFFDPNPHDGTPTSSAHSRHRVFHVTFKVLLTFMFSLLRDTSGIGKTILLIITVSGFALEAISHIKLLPYHRSAYNHACGALHFSLLWCALCLVLCEVIDDVESSRGLTALTLWGIPFAAGTGIVVVNRQILKYQQLGQRLQRIVDAMQRGDHLAENDASGTVIDDGTPLFATDASEAVTGIENNRIGGGGRHDDDEYGNVMNDSNPAWVQWRTTMAEIEYARCIDDVLKSPWDLEKVIRFHLAHTWDSRPTHSGRNVVHARAMMLAYVEASKKWPDHAMLQVFRAVCALYYGSSVHLPLRFLGKARMLSLTFDVMVTIERLTQITTSKLDEGHGVQSVIQYIQVEQHRKNARQYDLEATQAYVEFWKMLYQGKCDQMTLRDVAFRMTRHTTQAGKEYAAMIEELGDSVSPIDLRQYSSFLIDLGNNTTLAKTLMLRAADVEVRKSQTHRSVNRADGDGTVSLDVHDPNNAIVTISGLDSNLGQILEVSAGACQMFGYTEDEMVGRNIDVIVPPPINAIHDHLLSSYLDRGFGGIIGKVRSQIAVSRAGYIFPVMLEVSQSTRGADVTFLGVIQQIRNNYEYVIMTEQLSPMIFSRGCCMFQRESPGGRAHPLHIDEWFPQLSQRMHEAERSRGVRIAAKMPEGEELVDDDGNIEENVCRIRATRIEIKTVRYILLRLEINIGYGSDTPDASFHVGAPKHGDVSVHASRDNTPQADLRHIQFAPSPPMSHRHVDDVMLNNYDGSCPLGFTSKGMTGDNGNGVNGNGVPSLKSAMKTKAEAKSKADGTRARRDGSWVSESASKDARGQKKKTSPSTSDSSSASAPISPLNNLVSDWNDDSDDDDDIVGKATTEQEWEGPTVNPPSPVPEILPPSRSALKSSSTSTGSSSSSSSSSSGKESPPKSPAREKKRPPLSPRSEFRLDHDTSSTPPTSNGNDDEYRRSLRVDTMNDDSTNINVIPVPDRRDNDDGFSQLSGSVGSHGSQSTQRIRDQNVSKAIGMMNVQALESVRRFRRTTVLIMLWICLGAIGLFIYTDSEMTTFIDESVPTLHDVYERRFLAVSVAYWTHWLMLCRYGLLPSESVDYAAGHLLHTVNRLDEIHNSFIDDGGSRGQFDVPNFQTWSLRNGDTVLSQTETIRRGFSQLIVHGTQVYNKIETNKLNEITPLHPGVFYILANADSTIFVAAIDSIAPVEEHSVDSLNRTEIVSIITMTIVLSVVVLATAFFIFPTIKLVESNNTAVLDIFTNIERRTVKHVLRTYMIRLRRLEGDDDDADDEGAFQHMQMLNRKGGGGSRHGSRHGNPGSGRGSRHGSVPPSPIYNSDSNRRHSRIVASFSGVEKNAIDEARNIGTKKLAKLNEATKSQQKNAAERSNGDDATEPPTANAAVKSQTKQIHRETRRSTRKNLARWFRSTACRMLSHVSLVLSLSFIYYLVYHFAGIDVYRSAIERSIEALDHIKQHRYLIRKQILSVHSLMSQHHEAFDPQEFPWKEIDTWRIEDPVDAQGVPLENKGNGEDDVGEYQGRCEERSGILTSFYHARSCVNGLRTLQKELVYTGNEGRNGELPLQPLTDPVAERTEPMSETLHILLKDGCSPWQFSRIDEQGQTLDTTPIYQRCLAFDDGIFRAGLSGGIEGFNAYGESAIYTARQRDVWLRGGGSVASSSSPSSNIFGVVDTNTEKSYTMPRYYTTTTTTTTTTSDAAVTAAALTNTTAITESPSTAVTTDFSWATRGNVPTTEQLHAVDVTQPRIPYRIPSWITVATGTDWRRDANAADGGGAIAGAGVGADVDDVADRLYAPQDWSTAYSRVYHHDVEMLREYDSGHMHPLLDALEDATIGVISDNVSRFQVFSQIMLISLASAMILAFCFIIVPLIRHLDTQVQRTHAMLVTIPQPVLRHIPEVQRLLQSSSIGDELMDEMNFGSVDDDSK